MRKLFGFLIFGGLLVFLFATCPDKNAHNEAVIKALPQLVEDFGVDSSILDNSEFQTLINSFAGPLASALGLSIVDVDNYFLFSIGKFNGEIISFGIGGHVFTYEDKIVQDGIGLFKELQDKF